MVAIERTFAPRPLSLPFYFLYFLYFFLAYFCLFFFSSPTGVCLKTRQKCGGCIPDRVFTLDSRASCQDWTRRPVNITVIVGRHRPSPEGCLAETLVQFDVYFCASYGSMCRAALAPAARVHVTMRGTVF